MGEKKRLEMDGGLAVREQRGSNKGIYSTKHLVLGKPREGITETGRNPRLVTSVLAGNKWISSRKESNKREQNQYGQSSTFSSWPRLLNQRQGRLSVYRFEVAVQRSLTSPRRAAGPPAPAGSLCSPAPASSAPKVMKYWPVAPGFQLYWSQLIQLFISELKV